MAFNIADARALVVLVVLAIFAFVAHLFHYDTTSIAICVIIGVLIIMYLNKLYHREIKKDYFSRYDKIEVLEEEIKEETNANAGDAQKEQNDVEQSADKESI